MKTLYISDLDGTLFNSSSKITDFSRNAINRLVEEGMNISLATGRSISSAGNTLVGLNLKFPAVMMNGVFLTDISTKQQCYVSYIPQDMCKRVVDVFLKHGRYPVIYSYSGDIDAEYINYTSDFEHRYIESRKPYHRSFEQVSVYNFTDKIVCINALDKSILTDKIAEDLNKIDGINFTNHPANYNESFNFIEVYSPEAGKWNGIKRLKEIYGFDRVVAFGDNLNDLEMIKNADVGVCVKNAQKELLDVADVIIDANDNDGVAKFLLSEWEIR